jgi:hypothetical protein
MFFERSEVGKLVGMTGCLLSMLFILPTGAPVGWVSFHGDPLEDQRQLP